MSDGTERDWVMLTFQSQIKLNARMKESEEEVFRMCAEITAELVDAIVNDIGECCCARDF